MGEKLFHRYVTFIPPNEGILLLQINIGNCRLEELTQKGSARKPDIGDIIKVTEETEQTVRLGILRIAFAHFAQDRFGFLCAGQPVHTTWRC